MPRKGDRKEKPISGDTNDPRSLGSLLRTYLAALEMRNYSPATIDKYRRLLNQFVEWAEERSLQHPVEVTRPILERYQRHLYNYRTKKDKRLSFNDQHQRLSALRSWFKWLAQQRHVLHNPASELELPKLAHRLPKHVLNVQEAEAILDTTNVSQLFGLRDRAMLETLYSTGIRRMELINLQLYDVDHERGVLAVRLGKGQKDRVVPIGARALAWTAKYIAEARPDLITDENETTLYLTKFGESFSASSLSQLVGNYVNEAATGKTGSCHLFRHTMATLMLENGADVRYIQAMLGHAKLDTTQIYTRVAITKLKQVHENTHPARLDRKDNKQDPPNAGPS
jgi:integrase/recombinase XerD